MTYRFFRLFYLALLLLTAAGCATHNTVSDGDDSRLMLKGHDPVSYFTAGKPLPGRPDLKMDHEGVTYRFANEANLAQLRARTGAREFHGSARGPLASRATSLRPCAGRRRPFALP